MTELLFRYFRFGRYSACEVSVVWSSVFKQRNNLVPEARVLGRADN